jgi:hypothetical protein
MVAACLLLAAFAWDDARPEADPTGDGPVKAAVEKSLPYLQEDSVAWIRDRKCATCHHAPMAIWSLAEAKGRGFAVDQAALDELTAYTLGKPVDSKVLPDPAKPAAPGSSGFSLASAYAAAASRPLGKVEGAAAEGRSQLVEHLVANQAEDGSWPSTLTRPPISDGPEVTTLWAALALEAASGEPGGDTVGNGRRKADAWLAKTPVGESQQALALRLLLKARSGASPESLGEEVRRILDRQMPEGGWGQESDLPADAYATGLTLYALGAAGLGADRPEVRKAREFLCKTQNEDGTWTTASRAWSGGAPAKDLEPITFAGTAWATLGLLQTLPR